MIFSRVDAHMSDSPPDDLTFEEALSALEEVVRQLEDGRTGLEESLAAYEKGVQLLQRCYARLRQAEQRILLLTGTEAGQPVLQPFAHVATAEAKNDVKRSRKKPAGPDLPL